MRFKTFALWIADILDEDSSLVEKFLEEQGLPSPVRLQQTLKELEARLYERTALSFRAWKGVEEEKGEKQEELLSLREMREEMEKRKTLEFLERIEPQEMTPECQTSFETCPISWQFGSKSTKAS